MIQYSPLMPHMHACVSLKKSYLDCRSHLTEKWPPKMRSSCWDQCFHWWQMPVGRGYMHTSTLCQLLLGMVYKNRTYYSFLLEFFTYYSQNYGSIIHQGLLVHSHSPSRTMSHPPLTLHSPSTHPPSPSPSLSLPLPYCTCTLSPLHSHSPPLSRGG